MSNKDRHKWLHDISVGIPGGVWIQATYDPTLLNMVLVDVMNLDDSMLPPGVGEP